MPTYGQIQNGQIWLGSAGWQPIPKGTAGNPSTKPSTVVAYSYATPAIYQPGGANYAPQVVPPLTTPVIGTPAPSTLYAGPSTTVVRTNLAAQNVQMNGSAPNVGGLYAPPPL